MTTTYDPLDPTYLVDEDLRAEMVRVYDLCHGCRLCFKFCGSFPAMFEAIDAHEDQDSAKMTRAEQDKVVDECFNCKLCYVNCPYIPGQSDWNLDFPRLMLRAKQVWHATGEKSIRQRLTDKALGQTDLVGRVNTTANRLPGAPVDQALGKPAGPARRVLEAVTGITAERVMQPFARTRFSTWFRRRSPFRGEAQATAILFPTCLVEYQGTEIGRDLVEVYEHNGVECRLPAGERCCGAPFLHEGDLEAFGRQAAHNVALLADELRAAQARGESAQVVVPQPTCGYVLKQDYPDYLGTSDARFVADNTQDAAEFLWSIHKGDDTELKRDFDGSVPESVTYHAPCHLRAQNIGLKSRDLIKLAGAKVTVVAECSGIDGMWGLRAENQTASRKVGQKMGRALGDAEVIAGDCHLANGGITDETGKAAVHPMSLLARAYGVSDPSEPK